MKKLIQRTSIGKAAIDVWLDDSCTDRGLHGEWVAVDLDVHLNPDNDPEMQAETLIHEFTHAVSTFCHMNLSERQVQMLGQGLSELLKPWLAPVMAPRKKRKVRH